ncbi:MAG: ABC transporter substrate-binding protein [Anaerolineae bacterium]
MSSKSLVGSLLVAVVFLAAGCRPGVTPTSAPASPTKRGRCPVTGGSLVIGMESEADVLDPHASSGWVTHRVIYQIYESLVAEDLTQANVPYPPLVPGLAESWDVSPDGLVYTLHLRDGVRFHDGTPFDAEAVKINIDRMFRRDAPFFSARAAATTYYLWKDLDRVEVIGPLAVRLVFQRPFAEFPRMQAQYAQGSTGMISPTALQRWGNEGIADHPVGTGPFRFVERVRGDRIVLERNTDYWGPESCLDRLIFRPLPDPASRVNALQTGETDLIFVPPPDRIDLLKSAGFVYLQGPAPHNWFLFLNTRDPRFQDIRVRQAIAMAIDKEGLARELLKGTAKAAHNLQAPANSSYDRNFRGLPHDLERAKALLAEAGWADSDGDGVVEKDGKPFHFVFQTSVDGSGQLTPVPIARWIQRDLRKIGIDVAVETYEWITYIGVWTGGIKPEIGMNQISWGMTSSYWLDMMVNSRWQAPNGLNTNYYTNPEVDRLLDQALSEQDDAKRAALYRQANVVVMADAWHIPIVNDLAPLVMSPKVNDFIHAPQEWYDLRGVWIEK